MLATEGVDVLVVDDSSPDGTGEVVAAIARRTSPGCACCGGRPSRGSGERLPRRLPGRRSTGLRRRDRDGLRPLTRPGGAPDPAGSRPAPRPRRREPLHPGRIGDGLEPIRGSPCRGRATSTRDSCSACRSTTPRVGTGCTAVTSWRSSCAEPFAIGRVRVPDRARLRAHRLGYDVGEAPITFRDARYGTSKISNAIVARGVVEGHPLGLRPAVPNSPARLTRQPSISTPIMHVM